MKRILCILLVEDDPSLGPMTFHALNRLGHMTVLATTASAAYKYLSEPHQFHVILLDLQLGDQLSEALMLRLQREGIALPKIVLFSAQPIVELQRICRTIGAHGWVQKPSSIEQLDAAIDLATA